MTEPVSLRMTPEGQRKMPTINTWEHLTNHVQGLSPNNLRLPNTDIGVDNNLMVLEQAFLNPQFYNSLTNKQREIFLQIMRLHIEANKDYREHRRTMIMGCSIIE